MLRILSKLDLSPSTRPLYCCLFLGRRRCTTSALPDASASGELPWSVVSTCQISTVKISYSNCCTNTYSRPYRHYSHQFVVWCHLNYISESNSSACEGNQSANNGPNGDEPERCETCEHNLSLRELNCSIVLAIVDDSVILNSASYHTYCKHLH